MVVRLLKKMASLMLLVVMNLGLMAGAEAQKASAKKPLFLSYEQRLVLSYLLAGAGETQEKQLEISERFEKAFGRFLEMPVQEIHVNSFAEFLKAYQGNWPNSYSLESDLQLIERGELRGPTVIRGATPELQTQIDGFIRAQSKMMGENAKTGLFHQKVSTITDVIDGLIAQFKNGQSLDLRSRRPYVTAGFTGANELLKSHLDIIQETGEAIAKSDKMNSQDEAMALFMKTIFKEYFGRLGLASKKQIISQFLGSNLNSDVAQKFEIMVMNSGPQFQKLLQVVARDAGISEDLLAIFKKLESKANAIPEPLVRDIFESERDRYQWISYELKPMGTGTMAQVHEGKIRTWQGDVDVVIRFLKPEIEIRVAEDHQILKEVAPIMDGDVRFKKFGYPKLGPVVTDLNKTVMDELDLEATKARQRLGKEVYTRTLFFKSPVYRNSIELSVPGIYDGVPMAGKSKLMVQDLVVGTKLDKEAAKYKDYIPDFKRILIEDIAQVWVEEVLFKSGFFHSDLHQGNFMVQLTDPAINISILDFGMGGAISKQMQADLLVYSVALELNRAELIADALWSLSEKQDNKISYDELLKGVKERTEKIASGKMPWKSMDYWTAWALDFGLDFPYEFVSMNRGLAILDKSLTNAGSTLNTSALAKKMAMNSIGSVIRILRSKGLTLRDFIKLGWSDSPSTAQAKEVVVKVTGASVLAVGKIRCSQVHRKLRAGNLDFVENLLSF